MISDCESKPEYHSRYVDCSEDNANTIRSAADFDGGSMCERKANCYWDEVVLGQDRQRVYTDEEAAAADKKITGQ